MNENEVCFGCKHGGEYPSCLKNCKRMRSSTNVDIQIKERHGLVNWYERDLAENG